MDWRAGCFGLPVDGRYHRAGHGVTLRKCAAGGRGYGESRTQFQLTNLTGHPARFMFVLLFQTLPLKLRSFNYLSHDLETKVFSCNSALTSKRKDLHVLKP